MSVFRLGLSVCATTYLYTVGFNRSDSPTLRVFFFLYLLYSAALYVTSLFKSTSSPRLVGVIIDLAYYLAVITVTGGLDSRLLFLIVFPLMTAALHLGLAATPYLIFLSIVILAAGSINSGAGRAESAGFLIRGVAFFLLGLMLAYCGKTILTLRHRLSAVRDITRMSNPRFGVNPLIVTALKRLRTLYNAEQCILIINDPGTTNYCMFRTNAKNAGKEISPEAISQKLADKFLPLPERVGVIYSEMPRHWWMRGSYYYECDVAAGGVAARHQRLAREVAAGLNTKVYLSVPILFRAAPVGRLYLLASRCTFDASDVEFILQLIEQVAPTIENIRLADNLAAGAAEEERKKIARDIHDSVIQPYIGLQMGLSAIRRKLAAGDTSVGKDVEILMEVIGEEIVNLRGIVRGLRDDARPADTLLPAVKRFAQKFSDATGIQVEVRADDALSLHDRLAGEVFQMIVEGLSNIKRHTDSTKALIYLAREEDHLILRIENDSGAAPASFTPRSLTERAQALGGEARVERLGDSTAVNICVQL